MEILMQFSKQISKSENITYNIRDILSKQGWFETRSGEFRKEHSRFLIDINRVFKITTFDTTKPRDEGFYSDNLNQVLDFVNLSMQASLQGKDFIIYSISKNRNSAMPWGSFGCWNHYLSGIDFNNQTINETWNHNRDQALRFDGLEVKKITSQINGTKIEVQNYCHALDIFNIHKGEIVNFLRDKYSALDQLTYSLQKQAS